MTYLSAKKIYPGNWAEPLNGWYKNIDVVADGTNDYSKGGPTSVLAVPGYRIWQLYAGFEILNKDFVTTAFSYVQDDGTI